MNSKASLVGELVIRVNSPTKAPLEKQQVSVRRQGQKEFEAVSFEILKDGVSMRLLGLSEGRYEVRLDCPDYESNTILAEVGTQAHEYQISQFETGKPYYRAGLTKIFYDKREDELTLMLRNDLDEKQIAAVEKVLTQYGIVEVREEEGKDIPSHIRIIRDPKLDAKKRAEVLAALTKVCGGTCVLAPAIAGSRKAPVLLSGQFLARVTKGVSRKQLESLLSGSSFRVVSQDIGQAEVYHLIADGLGYHTLEESNVLSDLDEIEYILPAVYKKVVPNVIPADHLFARQWHHLHMRLPEAWDLLPGAKQFGSADVIVAAHDTGLRSSIVVPQTTVHTPGGYDTELLVSQDPLPEHPDFLGVVAGGTLSGQIGNSRKTYYAMDYDDYPKFAINGATETHGTEVLGIMGAATDGAFGAVGMAPNVRLMGMRVIGPSGLSTDEFANAFYFTSGFFPGWTPTLNGKFIFAKKLPAPFGTASNFGPGADIINMSHSYPEPASIVLNSDGIAIGFVTKFGRKRRGTLLFAASGNEDQDMRNHSMLGADCHVMMVAGASLNYRGYEVRTPYSSYSTTMNLPVDFTGYTDAIARALVNSLPAPTPAAPWATPMIPGIVTPTFLNEGDRFGTPHSLTFTTSALASLGNSVTIPAVDAPNFPIGRNVVVRALGIPSDFHASTITNNVVMGPSATITFGTAYGGINPIAVGAEIMSNAANDNHFVTTFNGTSAACPTVAGVAALVLTAKSTLTWAEAREIMRTTADPIAPRSRGFMRRTEWLQVNAGGGTTNLLNADFTMALAAPRFDQSVNFVGVPAGATQINIGSTAGYFPRQAILIGAEVTLSAGVAAGVNILTVNETDGLLDGMSILIGNDFETITDRPSTAWDPHPRALALGLTGIAGTQFSDFIYVQDISGFSVGEFITLDNGGPNMETLQILSFPGQINEDPFSTIAVPIFNGGETFTIQFATTLTNNHVAGERIVSANRENAIITTVGFGGNPNDLLLFAITANAYVAGTVIRQTDTEIRFVREIVNGSEIKIDPLEYPKAGTFKVEAGLRADYSHGFGYGRINAEKAVAAALAFTHNERDLMIRNFLTDDGVANRNTQPVHSPDIWVTNKVATPAGWPYATEGPHEHPGLDISAPVFAGVGLNDLEIHDSSVYPAQPAATYVIRIVSTGGLADDFTWSKDGGPESAPININLLGLGNDIGPGPDFKIKFDSISGHTIDDRWVIFGDNITNRNVHVRVKNRGTLSTFAPAPAPSLAVNYTRAYLALSDGSPVKRFLGTGKNDLTVKSDYTGATKAVFTVMIDRGGILPNKFRWAKDTGAFSAAITITPSVAQPLSDGVSIQFESASWHSNDEVWVLRCYPAAQKHLNIDHYIEANTIDSISPDTALPGTYFIGESSLAQIASNADSYSNQPWPEAQRPPRNSPLVALPARPLRMFLLGETVPHDGLLEGDIPEDNNNISYREILFARFLLQKQNGYEKFDNYIDVDGIGTDVTKAFKLMVIADAGSFNTETIKVMVEIDLEAGGTETKEYSYDTGSGTWTWVGGAPAWMTLTPPKINTTGFAAATGEQTQVFFEGTVTVDNAYQRIRFKPQVFSTINTTQVIADRTITVPIYELAMLPNTRYSSDPSALIPASHFFTDPTQVKLQTVAQAYGPISDTQFRVTSRFEANPGMDPSAYAAVSGFVMVQRVTGSTDTVNLILKPLFQATQGFTPIKYFIYRGIKLTDILVGDAPASEVLVQALGAGSPWIDTLWPIHAALNPTNPPFESKALGFDPTNQPAATGIDAWFFRDGANTMLPFAVQGVKLGEFNGTPASSEAFGFDIILEEGDAEPTYGEVRDVEHVITAPPVVPADPDDVKYAGRLKREEILRYMDVASFYGIHMSDGGKVEWNGLPSPAKGTDIYDLLIAPIFKYPNRLYVDIRNEVGASLNFFGAYDDGSGNALKAGQTSASMIARPYHDQDWPILIFDNSASPIVHANAYNELWMRLRLDYNEIPVLYLEHATPDVLTKVDMNAPRFITEGNLYSGMTPVETKDLVFNFPNRDNGSGGMLNAPWLIKLHYGGRVKLKAYPPKVLPNTYRLENVFGPIDLKSPWNNGDGIYWIVAQDKRFIDGDNSTNFSFMADRGLAMSGAGATERALFFAVSVDPHVKDTTTPVAAPYTPYIGITSGTTKRDTLMQEDFFKKNYNVLFDGFTDGATAITSLNFVRDPNFLSPEETFQLMGLSGAELTTLKSLVSSGITDDWQRHIYLLPFPGSPFTDAQGKTFYKYYTGISGLDINGDAKIDMPTVDIFTYSTDGLFYFTKAYSDLEPPVPYERNYEEAVGAMKPKAPAAYSVGNAAGSTFTILGIDLRREMRVGDQVGYETDNGTYTITAINYVGSDTQVVVSPAIAVPGPFGDLLAPDKTFEDYFIDKDYEGPLGGTTQMRSLVNSFIANVGLVPNDAAAVAAIQALIDTEAVKILDRARLLCRQNSRAYADDRILYWARIAMVVAIKSHPALTTRFSDRASLVKSFEDKSRGLDNASFAGAPVGAKKLLITGFDPFGLNPDPQLGNVYQSNPSGAIALALHGQTLPGDVYVQSALLPVRYSAFDRNPDGTGVVEDFYTRFIDSSAVGHEDVDMIMTVSQGSVMRFDVDRFAARSRGGGKDNENRPMTVPPEFRIRDSVAGDEFYMTKLPVNKMVVASTLNSFFKNTYNQTFYYQKTSDSTQSYFTGDVDINNFAAEITAYLNLFFTDGTWDGTPIKNSIENRSDAAARGLVGLTPNQLTASTNPKKSEIKGWEGSGGDYLSNESFYRVSRLRQQFAPGMETGHYHVPLIQTEWTAFADAWNAFIGLADADRITADFNPALTKKLIDRAEEGMSNALD